MAGLPSSRTGRDPERERKRWRQGYDEGRAHGALNQVTPAAYAGGVGLEQRAAA